MDCVEALTEFAVACYVFLKTGDLYIFLLPWIREERKENVQKFKTYVEAMILSGGALVKVGERQWQVRRFAQIGFAI